MKPFSALSVILAAFVAADAIATTRYVDLNSTTPVSPFIGWSTAATNIQDAIDVATSGDDVIVTNGVYRTGGRLGDQGLTNRVVISKGLTVRSVNGPEKTIIEGYRLPNVTNGVGAVRCVYLTNNASLIGFTLTNGATIASAGGGPGNYGGGAYCVTTNETLFNCIITDGSASGGIAGGVYRGTLFNCLLVRNSGAASGSVLNNCTLVQNFGSLAAATHFCTANNSIIRSNVGPTYWGGTFNFCCMSPLGTGSNNFDLDPLFVNPTNNFHLTLLSPCVNAGNNAFTPTVTDLQGNPRTIATVIDIGAYEFQSTVHFVNQSATNPVTPYTTWATAATNIQHAIDAAASGDTVLVTNGVYATGGRRWYDSGTNRVTLTNAITLRSVNGPAVTFIVGHQVVGAGTELTNAARCVGMGNNAVLSGFTLTNGSGGWGNYPSGGGVANLVSGTSTVTNCVLINNFSPASSGGGGAYRMNLINCQLVGNQAGYGGGACACTLVNCLVVSNTASYGGGVYGSSGFGTSALTNCTIVGNSATNSGGGVNNSGSGAMANCIVFYNTAPTGSNYTGIKLNYCCTTPVVSDLNSISNEPIFLNPENRNFRLLQGSPCINAGGNLYAPGGTDLDGNPRIAGNTIDIGAYEYQSPASILPYAWAQLYGLPVDGSADFADTDGDGLNNWQEWTANTNPTNAASVLMMNSPSNGVSDVTLTWQSVSGRSYFIQRALDLTVSPAFSAIKSNIVGQAGTTTYTDTTATNDGPYFYRIGVQ